MRASKGQWNLRSRQRRKSFSRLSGEAVRGNESRSSRNGLNSQHHEMTSSRLRSLFPFWFFDQCIVWAVLNNNRSERSSWDLRPERQGHLQHRFVHDKFELLFSKRQLARGQTSNIFIKLLLFTANNSFRNDWWFPKWSTIDTLHQHNTTSMIQLQASCEQRKTTIYRVLISSV